MYVLKSRLCIFTFSGLLMDPCIEQVPAPGHANHMPACERNSLKVGGKFSKKWKKLKNSWKSRKKICPKIHKNSTKMLKITPKIQKC